MQETARLRLQNLAIDRTERHRLFDAMVSSVTLDINSTFDRCWTAATAMLVVDTSFGTEALAVNPPSVAKADSRHLILGRPN